MEASRKILGRNLRALIKARGYLTVESFAYQNGINKSWVGKIIRGEIDPGFSKVLKLAKALDSELRDLYPGRKK